MIYDGFLFFNELDLLEIRLQELWNVVDKFILVESKWKHNGIEKPFWYADHKSRFAPFADKIIHIMDTENIDIGMFGMYANPPWGSPFCSIVENNQRNMIGRGLSNATDRDIIMLGDIDEIPKSGKVASMHLPNFNHSVCFVMDIFYYYLNNKMINSGWSGTVASHVDTFRNMQNARDTRMDDTSNKRTRINNAGWHFSYVGTPEMIAEKLECMADTANYKGREGYTANWVKEIIKKQDDVRCRMRGSGRVFIPQPLSTMPSYVQDNQSKFAHILKIPEKT
jgi:beta-1,4-mannosyl-glycoprotein beta-1,4-N-acetylglucosaminyltransferase